MKIQLHFFLMSISLVSFLNALEYEPSDGSWSDPDKWNYYVAHKKNPSVAEMQNFKVQIDENSSIALSRNKYSGLGYNSASFVFEHTQSQPQYITINPEHGEIAGYALSESKSLFCWLSELKPNYKVICYDLLTFSIQNGHLTLHRIDSLMNKTIKPKAGNKTIFFVGENLCIGSIENNVQNKRFTAIVYAIQFLKKNCLYLQELLHISKDDEIRKEDLIDACRQNFTFKSNNPDVEQKSLAWDSFNKAYTDANSSQ